MLSQPDYPRPPSVIAQEKTRWRMLALAWFVYVAFGLTTLSLVPIVTPVRAELGLSYSEMGLILGAWQFVYIGAAAPAGVLVDRIGPKRAIAVGAALVAASATLRVPADGFWSLLLAVAIFGLGGPIISVGLPKLVADWFTGTSRGLASGIYMTGSQMGGVLALALTNAVVLPATGGWRHALAFYAVVAIIIALIWLVLGRDSPETITRRANPEPNTERGRYQDVLGDGLVWTIVLIGFSGFLAGHGLRNWLPQIFETRGFDPTSAGYLGALPTLAGVIGSILILRFATRGRPTRRRNTAIVLLAIAACCVALIPNVSGPALVAVVALEGFCAAALTPLMLNTLMETPKVGAKHMGIAAGLYFAVGEAGGTLGPALLGVVADQTGSFEPGLYGLAAVTAAMIIPALTLRTGR